MSRSTGRRPTAPIMPPTIDATIKGDATMSDTVTVPTAADLMAAAVAAMTPAEILAALAAAGVSNATVLKAMPKSEVVDNIRERAKAGDVKPSDLAPDKTPLDVPALVLPTFAPLGDGNYTITVYRPTATADNKAPAAMISEVKFAAVSPVSTAWDSRLLDLAKIPASRNVSVIVRDGKVVSGAATTSRVSAPGTVRDIKTRKAGKGKTANTPAA